MGTSKSYFIVDIDRTDENYICFLAYYSLALKVICLKEELSGKKRGLINAQKGQKAVPTYYIAQLAKNDKYKDEIFGDEILESALDIINKAAKFVGGRIVWVEAKAENEGVVKFYQKNGFKELQREEQDDGVYCHLIKRIKY
ncbi:MAG: hypothetical protein MIO93_03310 [ANME-2 cluster archaeon]|nr:hypothetical protein [ANME-2 cluster archaeon]